MSSPTDIMNHIQERGERITLQRRLVIDALGHAHRHMTIHDIQQIIYEQGHPHPLSDTTVYRVLQWLKDLNLVSQTDMGQSGVVYALHETPCHHHLICLTCGKTVTVDDRLLAPLREQFAQDYGFSARIEHMAFYGYCRDCAASLSKE